MSRAGERPDRSGSAAGVAAGREEGSDRPTVFFLSQCLPYPPTSGVTTRTYHILEQLSEEFDVVLLAFSRRNHQPDDDALRDAREALEAVVRQVETVVRIPAETSKLRRAWDHLRSAATRRPYTYFEYEDDGFEAALIDVVRRHPPSLVHLDSMDLFRYLSHAPEVPVTCTHHSIESELLRLRRRGERSPVRSAYLNFQANLVEGVERTLCGRFDLNVMMSPVDAARLRRLAPDARTAVVPNGVDVRRRTPGPADDVVPGRVLFLGPTYMTPNRDAVDHFLATMWPAILDGVSGATFALVGDGPDELLQRYGRVPGVEALGHVPDIARPMRSARVCVVPLRIGGGTRLKILDAWAYGRPVVSTSIGCEGLRAVDGENILVRDEPAEFAEAVVELIRDDGLAERLGRAGRRTAEERYDWSIVGSSLRDAYRRLLREKRVVARGSGSAA